MTDLRFALRILWKNPGFTTVAALSLALGIDANTTVFLWMQNVLLRPFPGVAKPEELVVLTTTHGAPCIPKLSVRSAAFQAAAGAGPKDAWNGSASARSTNPLRPRWARSSLGSQIPPTSPGCTARRNDV